jgi:hypothetical protein
MHQLPPHTKILNMVLSEEQVKKIGRSVEAGYMLGLTNDFDQHVGLFSDCMPSERLVCQDGEWFDLQAKYDQYTYADAKRGACGRLQIVEHQGALYIKGFHTSGSEKAKVGRAVGITREFLSQYALEMLSQSGVSEIHALSFDLDDTVVQGAYCVEQGTITTDVVTSALDRTNFVPTPFTTHKFRGGAPIRPTNMNEVTLAVAKAKELKRQACGEPHPSAWDIVMRFKNLFVLFFLHFNPVSMLLGCSRLTFDEALTYHPKLPRFNPTTSRGLRLKIRKLKKTAVLGYDGVEPDPEARRIFEQDLQMYLDRGDNIGCFPYQINFDKLKDETLEHAFVDADKCRLFNITDFYDNVLMKISMGALIAKLDPLFLVGPQSCGINMRGSVASDIYGVFAGMKVIAMDISGFDNTVNALLMPVLVVIIRHAYASQRHRMWAYWAVLSTLQSLRFDRGTGRWRGHGNTSGNWLTTWINTLMNTIYFLVVVVYLAYKNGEDPELVVSEFKLRVYSDDNLSALARAWYHPLALKEAFFELFSVELTNTDKSEVTADSVYSIDDAEFLSRTFRYAGGLVFCPLALPSLFGQLYYVRCPRGANQRKFVISQLAINLNNVVSELYEYDAAVGDALAIEILAFLEKVGLPPSLFPYEFGFDRAVFKLTL